MLDLEAMILATMAPLEEEFIKAEAYRCESLINRCNDYVNLGHSNNPHISSHDYVRKVVYAGRDKAYYREGGKFKEALLEVATKDTLDVSSFYPSEHPIWRSTYGSKVINKYLLKRADSFDSVVALRGQDHYEACREKARLTLRKKLSGFNVVSLEPVSLRQGTATSDGIFSIEGIWKFSLEDGRKGFITTEAITAGGYNIQRLHVRYLVKVKVV